MKNILVSIVIPVYNGSNYLGQAIDSALAQTYENIEVIVVNDGSKDDGLTEKVALSYGDKIRYFYKENGGISSALNYGISHMEGEYFSWLSHDDLYVPNKIEKQIEKIETKNDIILCSGSLIDENGKMLIHHTKTLDKTLTGRELFEEFLHRYALNGLGFLIPKHAFEKVGGFDESLRYLQDLDMWMRLMWYDYRFKCHSDLLVVTRVHRNQLTNTGSDIFFSDRLKMAEKHLKLLKETEVCEREKLIKLYFVFFMRGDYKKAIKQMKPEMKKMKGYHLFYLKCCFYKFKGYIRKNLRKIREIFYKTKKVRG